jgi:protocatechuate 4,5-dioxygenase beta chain
VADLFAGLACSHVPAIGAALDNGKSGEPYWRNVFSGFDFAKQWIAEAKPDVVILVYNDHATAFSLELIPVHGDPEFAAHLAQSIILDEFDLTLVNKMAVDHGLSVPLSLVYGQPAAWPVKVIPLAVNVVQFPPPTGRRCYMLGKAIARAVASYDKPLRVMVWGTGGMSHQIQGPRAGLINREFDQRFMDLLVNDPEAATRIKHVEYMREAGSEGVELVMWLVMPSAPRASWKMSRACVKCAVSIMCRPRTRPSGT